MSLEYLQSRFVTRSIKVGDLEIGGSAPIVVQSMTTSDTMNVDATVQQIQDLKLIYFLI
jgi:(E)-4-hydroxy-3-methylbut-2-enyl-diphosphate synthase